MTLSGHKEDGTKPSTTGSTTSSLSLLSRLLPTSKNGTQFMKALNAAQSKMESKEAMNWVNQLLKLFPQASPPTHEMVAAIVSLACQYSRNAVIKTFSPDGLPSKFNYLPSLHDMKLALNEAGAAEFDGPQKSKRVLEQFAERQKYARKTKAPYTGPIEA